MAFQGFTGYYAIIAYSEILLQDEFKEGTGKKIGPRGGVLLI